MNPKSKILSYILFFVFLFSDVTIAQVGIGTTDPKSTFEVNGTFGQKVSTITTTTTLDDSYGSFIICNNASVPISITLPAVSSCTGRVYTIKRNATSTANITLVGAIDGVSNLVMAKAGEAVTLFSNGSEWKAASSNNSSSSSDWNLTGNTGSNTSTNFIGTTDATGLVVKTNSTPRVTLSSDGVTKIGDIAGGNNTKFEADGTIVLEGNASVWDDLLVNPDATGKGSNSPTFSAFKNGVKLWMFDSGTMNEVFFTIQLPHRYKVETNLFPHVHWTTVSGTPTSTNVVWGLEYTVVSIGSAFPTTSTIKATSMIASITPSGTGQHIISSFDSPISGTGLDISAILVCRLFRDVTHSNDTFVQNVGLLSVDFHFEIDTEGSRTPFTK